MKRNRKVALIAVFFAILCISGLAINKINVQRDIASAAADTGKWVAYYGGGSSPILCECVAHIFRKDCIVGDTTTRLSLCVDDPPPA